MGRQPCIVMCGHGSIVLSFDDHLLSASMAFSSGTIWLPYSPVVAWATTLTAHQYTSQRGKAQAIPFAAFSFALLISYFRSIILTPFRAVAVYCNSSIAL